MLNVDFRASCIIALLLLLCPSASTTFVPPPPPLGQKKILSGVSEVVQVYTMGAYQPSMDAASQTLCPIDVVANLVPFSNLVDAVKGARDVTIPPNTAALISSQGDIQGEFVYRRIVLSPGSTLVFADTPLRLHVEEIVVNANASLLMGSESCRYTSNIDIIFHGSFNTSSHSNADFTGPLTSKGLVNFGKVEVHGKLFWPTWTRLSYTAFAGNNTIYLQDRVNWEVGQRILITTTVYYDCPPQYQKKWCSNNPHQNEVRTITFVSMDDALGNYVVIFDKPLTYMHYAGIEYQAEVALLSRKIRLQGSQSNDSFGCHTINMYTRASARFSGVNADNCGQLNVGGRYPFHFHLMYEAPTSFFKDNSVTNSFFKAYVIHGTNSTNVISNVAYNVSGMAFYLEDGVEENNKLRYNLAAYVHPIMQPANGISHFGTGLDGGAELFYHTPGVLFLPADVSAAGYYILNGNNEFLGNTASGGWSGFVLPNAVVPLEMFKSTLNYDSPWTPWHRPLALFLGNTAHSSGFYGDGANIYVGAWLGYPDSVGYPGNVSKPSNTLTYNTGRFSRNTYIPGGPELILDAIRIQQVKCYLGNIGVFDWGYAVEITGEFHDVFRSVQIFTYASLSDSLVNARSKNPFVEVGLGTRIGFQFYDTNVPTTLKNIIFRGFTRLGLGLGLGLGLENFWG